MAKRRKMTDTRTKIRTLRQKDGRNGDEMDAVENKRTQWENDGHNGE